VIGKAYVSIFKYYDNIKGKMSFKNRPVLIVGKADNTDYIVLPISRVTKRENLDEYYDVLLNPDAVPKLNLTQHSYVRTHKQSVVNIVELYREITDFKKDYMDIYLDIISKMEEFQKNLIDNAL
jgi:hypothetical protein